MVSQHFCLRAPVRCWYVWEYDARCRYDASPANDLIANLKIRPSEVRRSRARQHYKTAAIEYAATALRRLVPSGYAESDATFVPVPGSKKTGDTEHDDRMVRVLQHAFAGRGADVRSMVELRQSTAADHEGAERLSYEELLAVSSLNDLSRSRPRPIVVVVDDVLNSGKHFRVAQTLINTRFPHVKVRGLFLARCRRGAWGEVEKGRAVKGAVMTCE